jgi:hypothetical protein
MALVVEDGTAKSDADSYISVADADTYFAAHGNPAAWKAADTETKEAALRYACVWEDGNWNWRGEIVLGTQARSFPRYSIEDHEGRLLSYTTVPQRIPDAQCELALVHIADALNAVSDTSGGEIKAMKLGPMALEYVDRTTSYSRKVPYVSKLLKGLYTGGGWMVPVVRA